MKLYGIYQILRFTLIRRIFLGKETGVTGELCGRAVILVSTVDGGGSSDVSQCERLHRVPFGPEPAEIRLG